MPVPCDPLFGDVVLLLNFQGTDGQTTTVDESSYARSVFQSADGVNPVALTDTYFKWPPTSLKQIDGDKYYRCAPAAETDLTSADFCFEAWIDIQATTNPGWQVIVNQNFTTEFPLAILFSVNNGLEARGDRAIGAGGGTAYLCNILPIPAGWCHIAVVRNGDQFALYLNGVAGTMTYPLGGTGFAGNLGTLGNTGDTTLGGSHSSCNVAGIRWTVGNPRYTANFTPPAGPFGLECAPAVPNIVGLAEADANETIIDAGFIVGTVTEDSSESIPEGSVISQDPPAGTIQTLGDPIDYVLSTGSAFTLVPDIVGLTLPDGTAALIAAVLGLGVVTNAYSSSFPVGTIIDQSIPPGVSVLKGTPINVTRSLGAAVFIVPDVRTLSLADAEAAIVAAGFTVGSVGVDLNPTAPLGEVVHQNPIGGIIAALGSRVDVVVTALFAPFDARRTVISQYANSPTLLRLVDNMAEYLDPRADITNFYNLVWNVDTAKDWGLDIWGRIVGVSRLLKIAADDKTFGFDNEDVPPDWEPFNQGTFASGSAATQTYTLPDDSYRTLVLTKALANIAATTAPGLNRLLQNLFPGRGRAYVLDLGNMSMRFVFEFSLSPVEYAILTQSGVLPHPAGVFYSVVVLAGSGSFGFKEMGAGVQTFGHGSFYTPAG